MDNQEIIPQRTRVRRAAAQLFAERGYHAVSMSDIQAAVQLGRGALYHYISSKEDLLYDIMREYIADLVENGSRLSRDVDPRERILRLGQHLILKIAANKAELTVCFREVGSLTGRRQADVASLHAQYEQIWRDTLVDGATAGVMRPYDPIVLKAILGMYFHSFIWLRPSGSLSPEAIAKKLGTITLDIVNSRPHRLSS